MSEIVLVSVSGADRPGLNAELTEIMGRHGVEILDIGQGVVHANLAWGALILVPPESASSSLFKELVFRAHELDLTIRFTPISEAAYGSWVGDTGRPRHVVTLLGRRISAADMARVSRAVANHGLNIERIERLSGRIALDTPESERSAAVELSVRGAVADADAMHEDFLRISQETPLDVAVQADTVLRRYRRLVCFDMDSTLVAAELMDELAREAGVAEEVARLTAAAMHGDLDFRASFSQRLALLRGLPERVLGEVAGRLPITEGAERLVANLKQLGFKVAILSGGFTYFAERLRERLDIDYVHAHELEIRDGCLTGRIHGPVIDGEEKARLLRQLAARNRLSLEQVIAVGDGANDLPMLRIAGLGIAFHAKPLVQRQARHAIATLGLDGILYLLGMREHEITDA